MLPQPIQTQLAGARRVLVAGAGGGADVLCALPLYFALEAAGCEAYLGSLSASALRDANDITWHTNTLAEVTAHSSGPTYFPEAWLARWFHEQLWRDVSVWCFSATGVRPYAQSYAWLATHLQLDAVVVVDGGVDTLLRGDEYSLGTPLWDALTIAAVNQLEGPRKFLASVGFGAERWDKISHAQVLARIADLTRADAWLGVSTLLRSTQEGARFMEAAQYLFEHQPDHRPGTIASSILAAMRGEFGERSLNAYTTETPLWISPLMCLYWFFDLPEVARQKLYLARLLDTETLMEAADLLHAMIDAQEPGEWETIPI